MPSVNQAIRGLRNDPVFTTVAICSLAIGIGATSAMFSFADALLLRPLPVRDPERVVVINTAVSAMFGENPWVSYPDYLDLRDRTRSFDGMAAASYAFVGFTADTNATPRMKLGLYVSGNFFRVLGVSPALGRDFRLDEDQVAGRDPVVVLGHDFWASQFESNPSVIGSRIRLSGIDFTIIGVAPQHFTGIDVVMRPQVFIPLAMSPRLGQRDYLHDRDFGWLFVKARLKSGVGIRRAQADVEALSPQLERLHAHTSRDHRLTVESELQFRVAQGPTSSTLAAMLVVLGICVLAVACANVAGLLLSRDRARTREIAVRLAIGAGRLRLIWQLLLENVIVAVAGGLGGILAADTIAQMFRRIPVPTDVPAVFDMGVNRRVFLFTLAISVGSTLLFGLAPALRATRPDLVPALKAADADSGGRQTLWGRNTIVAGQVALSLVLLAVSAALVQGFRGQLMQGPGFRIERLFLATFDTQLAHDSPGQTERFYRDLLNQTRAAPGVRSAALTSVVPMEVVAESQPVVPEGWQAPPGEAALRTFGSSVSDGYFATMGIRLRSGREFLPSDGENTPLVAVVNETLADRFWKGDAVGKRFHLGDAAAPMVEIVGVANNSKYAWIAEPPMDFVYLPCRQHPNPKLSLVVESIGPDADAIAPVLRRILHNLDRNMPVFDARSMHDFYTQRAVKTTGILVQIVTGMGLMGLALAVVGLYGLVAYSVSRRTHEIGIRMALGAHRGDVMRMVLRQGLKPAVAGVTIGLVLAIYACRAAAASMAFFGFHYVNPLVLIALPLLLLLVTVLAAWEPARRASRIDPMRALRDE
jgi:predicted permease